MIVILSGPSCVGKTTIVEELHKRNPEWNKVINYTTRLPREDEILDVHYKFISRGEFEAKLNAGVFAEHDEIYGNLYGIAHGDISRDPNIVSLMILFTDSIHHITSKYDNCLTVFIKPPSFEILQDRMVRRGVDEPQKSTRLNSAIYELKNTDKCQHVITNECLEKTCEEVEHLIRRRNLALYVESM